MFIFYVISKIHGFGNYSTGSSIEFKSTLKMIERFREINYISIKDRKLQKKIKYKVLNCYLFFKDVYSCNIVDMQIFITLTCVTQFFFFAHTVSFYHWLLTIFAENYQRMELERKKSRISKQIHKGPIIRYHSLTMPLIEELPPEPEISVDEDNRYEITFFLNKRMKRAKFCLIFGILLANKFHCGESYLSWNGICLISVILV